MFTMLHDREATQRNQGNQGNTLTACLADKD